MEGQWILISYIIILMALSALLFKATKTKSKILWKFLLISDFLCCLGSVLLSYYLANNEANGMFMSGFGEELFSYFGAIAFVVFYIVCIVIFKVTNTKPT